MRRVLVFGLVLAACAKIPDRVPTGTELSSFTVSLDVWSGSELTITSAGLRSTTNLPAVLLDGSALPTRRIDDTTLAATLPDSPGPHAVRLAGTGFDPQSVNVYLRGFAGYVEGPALSGRTEPGRDPRYVFGNGPLSLRRWNVEANKAIDLGDSVHAVFCTRGIGPGPNVGEIVLTPMCESGRWNVWHTEPLYPLADTAAVRTARVVAVLATGRWVVLGMDTVFVNACSAGTCTTEALPGTDGRDVIRSPRGDRAALLARVVGDPAAPGAPVLDATLGTVAYRVTALRDARGAAFSLDGETLYLAGAEGASGPFTLAAVRAGDGAPLSSARLDFEPCAVAVDPAASWLYVAGSTATGQGRLVVFDPLSLEGIASLHVTSVVTVGGSTRLCRIMPNPVGHLVYVVDTWAGAHDAAARAHLFRFETPR